MPQRRQCPQRLEERNNTLALQERGQNGLFLPIIYKVSSHIILSRLLGMLNLYIPKEQSGFREGFSTIDHTQVVSQLRKKANECNILLYFAFVDCEKVFNSIEFTPLLTTRKNQALDHVYNSILKDLYSGAATSTRTQVLPRYTTDF
ncbi:uncharacterized protein LOC115220727 [Octopus sinensis]|uniref:Uncharacterized protein LOC115220727 n=1 Tax=Octopus sinensis TaxID=2607531 RepID=A0A6P7T746_9MOLL|nr:uncharacterized protein LOC115220727 [Octopus sinensis]